MDAREIRRSRYRKSALMVVDMQRYYLEPEAPYCRFYEHLQPGALSYIRTRCEHLVTPNIQRLLRWGRERGVQVVYLRLAAIDPARRDLHRSFRQAHERAERSGFPDLYPLESDPFSDVIPALEPAEDDLVMLKGTYSGFTDELLESALRSRGIETLVFTGLATSQCVETTARDASERDFRVIHIEDAQADYDERVHRASLYASSGVCGGLLYSTQGFLRADPLNHPPDLEE